jgi:multisubunit Na+/H+ antiporter MnhC subunit
LIALEILIKGATLLIILAGYATGQEALAQSLVITLIVIEVVVMTVAVGVVLGIRRHTGSLDISNIRNLKG